MIRLSVNHALLAVSGLNTLVGWYVYRKNPTTTRSRAFAAFAAGIGLWSLGLYFAHSEAWAYTSLYRLAFAAGSLIPLMLIVFTKTFPGDRDFSWGWEVKVLTLIAVSLGILAFTPSMVVSLSLTPNGPKFVYGPLYPVFALYFLACFAYAFSRLVWQYRRSSGHIKLQLRYLILGLVFPGTFATITNVLIPLVFGTSQFAKYGPLFSVVMILMIGHAIIRHRFMDIRVVIRKGAVYLAAFAVAGAILTGLIIGANALFPEGRWGILRDVMLGLVVAFLFAPLKNRIQRAFDRYLYRQSYDYQRTFREASRTMVTMLDLRTLLPYLCELIERTVRPEAVSVFIRDAEAQEFRLAAAREASGSADSVLETAALPALLAREHAHFLTDDLGRENSPEIAAARAALSELGGEMALPILDEDHLSGFVIVGSKRSGDPYFSEDLDLLSTLSSQAAIAIKNAQLYHQIVLVNEYVDNILRTMESGVIAVGVHGTITLFNPAAERMTGLGLSAVRTASVDHLAPALAGPIKATLADGQSRLQVETTISSRTGHATPVVCSTSPFRDVQGDLIGAVLVFSDLTRLKELEKEKLRADRLASFGALASGIAHEIKNPLVAIKTFAQLLPTKFTEAQFREGFAKVAVREIGRIEGLVDRLRDLSRPAEDMLRVLDIREPIEATLELLHAQFVQAGTSVRRIYPDRPWPVLGDPARLEQLFLNLFQNAIEAMGPGGELTIRLDNEGAAERDATLRARISDTGPGIPLPLVDRIFQPFVTTKSKGSGLGLAICRAIADAHRATIRLENSAGDAGATVTLEFPVALEALQPLEA